MYIVGLGGINIIFYMYFIGDVTQVMNRQDGFLWLILEVG